ncbi:hypothetical protein [Streptomyces sp. HO565]|uniref:hypothetical protein n=1 Tax=Streptomyces sp. HO565 TaxID=2857489 RepID=UPI0034DB8E3E
MNDPLAMHTFQEQNPNQLYDDMRHDYWAGERALRSEWWPVWGVLRRPLRAKVERVRIRDLRTRRKAQDEARALVLKELSRDQADAPLILSMDRGAMKYLLDTLWQEYQADVRDGAPGITDT